MVKRRWIRKLKSSRDKDNRETYDVQCISSDSALPAPYPAAPVVRVRCKDIHRRVEIKGQKLHNEETTVVQGSELQTWCSLVISVSFHQAEGWKCSTKAEWVVSRDRWWLKGGTQTIGAFNRTKQPDQTGSKSVRPGLIFWSAFVH